MKILFRALSSCLLLGWLTSANAPAQNVTPMVKVDDGGTLAVKHAIACPPFKGESILATRYRDALLQILGSTDGIELLEGAHAKPSRSPRFTYRIQGEVFRDARDNAFVSLVITDSARNEPIGSYMASASLDDSQLKAWSENLRNTLLLKTAQLPFECGISRHRTQQESLTLDRGLSAGLQPGVLLELAADEVPLISPVTGEEVGRDAGKSIGIVEVFRVSDRSAYARLKSGTLPKRGDVFARTF